MLRRFFAGVTLSPIEEIREGAALCRALCREALLRLLLVLYHMALCYANTLHGIISRYHIDTFEGRHISNIVRCPFRFGGTTVLLCCVALRCVGSWVSIQNENTEN